MRRRFAPVRFLRNVLLLVPMAAVCVAGVGAAPQSVTEVNLKSAFLYKFTLFANWNDGLGAEGSPISICVLGRDDLGDALQESVEGRRAHHRPLVVERPGDAREARDCHIVFIGWTDPSRVDRTLKALEGRPILTVGEIDGFAERGGMIAIVTRQNRLRLEINLRVVKNAGLRLSSQLLKLAKLVDVGGG